MYPAGLPSILEPQVPSPVPRSRTGRSFPAHRGCPRNPCLGARGCLVFRCPGLLLTFRKHPYLPPQLSLAPSFMHQHLFLPSSFPPVSFWFPAASGPVEGRVLGCESDRSGDKRWPGQERWPRTGPPQPSFHSFIALCRVPRSKKATGHPPLVARKSATC